VPVRLRYHTDPACPASWAAEPLLRRLVVEFGADLSITYVMGGLAREYEAPYESRVTEWLEHADRSGMPFDPRLWTEGPIRSTYPACMAVKAAAEQGAGAAGRYLRALREGLMCHRRKLDTKEALVEEARGAGLDVGRFRIDLDSNAIIETFGADLEATRAHGRELPFFVVGEEGLVYGPADDLRTTLVQAGAEPSGDPRPDVLAALGRFGRLASVEVEAVCDLPGPRANAELWRLAAEWRVRPVRVLTGTLWEAA
jgi:predicted DsbA family dithiol-disulfide isomerase